MRYGVRLAYTVPRFGGRRLCLSARAVQRVAHGACAGVPLGAGPIRYSRLKDRSAGDHSRKAPYHVVSVLLPGRGLLQTVRRGTADVGDAKVLKLAAEIEGGVVPRSNTAPSN